MKKQLRLVLGLGLFIVLVGGSLFIANRPTAQANDTLSVNQSEAILLGKSLYLANCAQCHGTDRSGYAQAGIPAPALNGQEHDWHHSDEQLLAIMAQGGNKMPAVGSNWSQAELEAVLAYIKQGWSAQQRRAQVGAIGE